MDLTLVTEMTLKREHLRRLFATDGVFATVSLMLLFAEKVSVRPREKRAPASSN